MKIAFGLDFGTTNSALSINIDGKVEVINIDNFNIDIKTLKSVLYFNENKEVFVGQEAIENYIKEHATGRFMQSIKTFLPCKLFDYTFINGRKYEIEDLIAIILKIIKKRGEEYVGKKVDTVVMGRPVFFSNDPEEDKLAEDRLKKAAQQAGFKKINFQLEPVAAALTFEKTLRAKEEKTVLIGDFGGGTSDFTIIKLRSNTSKKGASRQNDILAIGGIYVGGDIFDSQIMWHKITQYFGRDVLYESMPNRFLEMPCWIPRTLCQWHRIPQLKKYDTRRFIEQLKQTANKKKQIENLAHLIDKNLGFMIFQAIERAKIELSFYEKSYVVFKNDTLLIKKNITQKYFNKIIKEDVLKIKQCLENTISKSKILNEDIDYVFITGGSSYIPCIRQIFVDKFGENKIRQMDAFTSVVYGLGVSTDLY